MGERALIVTGLLVAVVTGLVGGGFSSVDTKSVLYAVSSLGWVAATALLAGLHLRRGETLAAAGFLVLTIAEALLWVSGRPGDPDYASGFAGGTMFYVPGLLMIGLVPVYHLVIRALAVAAGAVWAVAAAGYLTGSGLAEDDPIAILGYSLVSAAFIGIAVAALRSRAVDA